MHTVEHDKGRVRKSTMMTVMGILMRNAEVGQGSSHIKSRLNEGC